MSAGFWKLTRKSGPYPRGFEPTSTFARAAASYRWSDSWQTEVGYAWGVLRRDVYDEELWDTPEFFNRVLLIHSYRILRIDAAQIYHFGRARVRPFVGVGVAFEVDRQHDSRDDHRQAPLTAAVRDGHIATGIVLTPVDLFPCVQVATSRGPGECALPNAESTTTRLLGVGIAGVRVATSARTFVTVRAALTPRQPSFGVGFGFGF
jgi:hypothetical protein